MRISDETGLIQQDVQAVLQKSLDYIVEALKNNSSVEFRNFGVFKSKFMEPRYGSNPRNKKKIYIPSKWKVTFKASEKINKKLNEKT